MNKVLNVLFIYFLLMHLFEKQNFSFAMTMKLILCGEIESSPFLFFVLDDLRSKLGIIQIIYRRGTFVVHFGDY